MNVHTNTMGQILRYAIEVFWARRLDVRDSEGQVGQRTPLTGVTSS